MLLVHSGSARSHLLSIEFKNLLKGDKGSASAVPPTRYGEIFRNCVFPKSQIV